jgi:hypothetical protein
MQDRRDYEIRPRSTLECQNLTAARAFDRDGAQRPGRSCGFKLTGRR